jgi:hypothetical protein
MKTTLKTLICAALCCAASAAFADPPPDSTTSMTFKDPTVANCAGAIVGSVGLGPGNDVSIQTTTTANGNPVTGGKVQLDIATDGIRVHSACCAAGLGGGGR